MPVFRGSRYDGVRFTGILGEDGKVRKFLHARESLTLQAADEPILVQDFQRADELDALANRAAGKPRLWWVLADVNDTLFPLSVDVGSTTPGITPGTEIAVPLVQMRDRQEFGG